MCRSICEIFSCQYKFIILLAPFELQSGRLLGKRFPHCVLMVFCLFVILDIRCFGFEGGVCFLIAPVPVRCSLVTFCKKMNWPLLFNYCKIKQHSNV